MAIEIVCDKCEATFKIKLEEVNVKDGNTKAIFVCPSCQHEYLAFVTNESIREKQKDIRELRKQMQSAKGKVKRVNRLIKKIKRKQVKLDQEMARLKEKVAE